MKRIFEKNGSVLVVVVFAIALLTAFVVGMLQLNAEQIQVMKNEIFAAQAMEIAHAGLADAFGRIRSAHSLPASFSSNFGGGSYTVAVAGVLPDPNFVSTGTSAQGFVSKIQADVTVDTAGSYVIRIDKLRINE